MATLAEIREQYPQYGDMSDMDLAGALHAKFYSDMPQDEYLKKLGLKPPGGGSALARGIDEMQGSLYSAAEGAGRLTGIASLERVGREGRVRNEAEAEASLPSNQRMSFEQAQTAGDYGRAGLQALGTSLPSSVGPLAGAAAGALVGSAVPVVGTGIGALVGGFAGAYPQFFGSNRQRQIEASTERDEQGRVTKPGEVSSEGAALAAAVPQAAADAIVGRFTLGLGKVLGLGSETVARTIVPRIVAGAGKGAAAEVPSEVFQTALERAQAGLSLTDADAMKEYKEAATAAAVLGGSLGGASAGAFGPRPARPGEADAQRDRETETALETLRADARRRMDEQPLQLGQRLIDTPLGLYTPQQIIDHALGSNDPRMLEAAKADVPDTAKVDIIAKLMRYGPDIYDPLLRSASRPQPGETLYGRTQDERSSGQVMPEDHLRMVRETEREAEAVGRIRAAREARAGQDPRAGAEAPLGAGDLRELTLVPGQDGRPTPVGAAGYALVTELDEDGNEVQVPRPFVIEIDPRTGEPAEGAQPFQYTDGMAKQARGIQYPRPGVSPRAMQEFHAASQTARARGNAGTLTDATNQARATDRLGTNSDVPGQDGGDPYGTQGRPPRYEPPETKEPQPRAPRTSLDAAFQEAAAYQGDNIPAAEDFTADRAFFGRPSASVPPAAAAPAGLSEADKARIQAESAASLDRLNGIFPGAERVAVPPGEWEERSASVPPVPAVPAVPEVPTAARQRVIDGLAASRAAAIAAGRDVPPVAPAQSNWQELPPDNAGLTPPSPPGAVPADPALQQAVQQATAARAPAPVSSPPETVAKPVGPESKPEPKTDKPVPLDKRQEARQQLDTLRKRIEATGGEVSKPWMAVVSRAEAIAASREPGRGAIFGRGASTWTKRQEGWFQDALRELSPAELGHFKAALARYDRLMAEQEAQAKRLGINEPWRPDSWDTRGLRQARELIDSIETAGEAGAAAATERRAMGAAMERALRVWKPDGDVQQGMAGFRRAFEAAAKGEPKPAAGSRDTRDDPIRDLEEAGLDAGYAAGQEWKAGWAPAPAAKPKGRSTTIQTVSGMKVQADYELVDLDSLKKAEGVDQPRDRTRAASDGQISELFRIFNPAEVIEGAGAQVGAPIVGPTDTVESGNGRIAVLRRVRDESPEKWAAYQAALREAGYEPGPNQVLIRRRTTELSPEQLRTFVVDANTKPIMGLSGTEQGLMDRDRIDVELLTKLDTNADLFAAKNDGFVRAFISKLSANERNEMLDDDGGLSQAGARRIEAAILARAYGNPALLKRVTEDRDDDSKSVSRGLLEAAPAWIGLQASVARGDVKPQFDITKQVLGAVDLLWSMRSQKKSFKDFRAQVDPFLPKDPISDAIFDSFFDPTTGRAKAAGKVAGVLERYVAETEKKTTNALFDDDSTPLQAVQVAVKEPPPKQPGLFSSRQGQTITGTPGTVSGDVARARKVIDDRLAALRAMGKQGVKAAEGVQRAMAGPFSPQQVVAAFHLAEASARILGDRSLVIRFLPEIMHDGVERQGQLVKLSPHGTNGLVHFSLSPSSLSFARQTGAHEAFHVAQALFAASDPKIAAELKAAFPEGKGWAGIDATLRRKLQTTKPRGGAESYWDNLTKDPGVQGETDPVELQAYVFGALDDARRNGQSLVGIKPILLRFANFLNELRKGVGSALRGDGFRTVSRTLGAVSEGGALKSLGRAADITKPFSSRSGEPITRAELKVLQDRYDELDKAVYGGPPTSRKVNFANREKLVAAQAALNDAYTKPIREVDDFGPPASRPSAFNLEVDLDRLQSDPDYRADMVKRAEAAIGVQRDLLAKADPGSRRAERAQDRIDNWQQLLDEAQAAAAKPAPGKTDQKGQGLLFSSRSVGPALKQEFSSADTSVKQLAATFRTVDWKPGTRNFDLGGGRYDLGSDYLRERGVENMIYDPFNRSDEHNTRVLTAATETPTDTATINNVLNVIKEPEVRAGVIRMAAQAIKPDGTAHFLVYEGDRKGVGKQTSKGWQNNMPAATFLGEVRRHFGDVTRKGNLIVAKEPSSKPLFSSRSRPADLVRDAAISATYDVTKGPEDMSPGWWTATWRGLVGAVPGENWREAIYRNAVNRAAPLRQLEEMMKKNGILDTPALERMADRAFQNTGRLEMVLEHHPMGYDPKTDRTFPRKDVGSVLAAFVGPDKKNPRVKDSERSDFQNYLALRREKDLLRSGRSGFKGLTSRQVMDGLAAIEAKRPAWQDAAADIQKINQAMLDFGVATGILDPVKAKELAAIFYTPFYRQAEAEALSETVAGTTGPNVSNSLNNPHAFEKTVHESDAPIGDLFENMVRNYDFILRSGEKNVVLRATAEGMEKIKDADGRPMAQRIPHRGPNDKQVITLKVGGETRFYKLANHDPTAAAVFLSLVGVPAPVRGAMFKAAATMAGIFRTGVTSLPSYMMANLWRGKLTAYAQEGLPFHTNTIDGMRQVYQAGSSQTLQDFAAETGFGGFTYGMGEKNVTGTLARKVRTQGGEASTFDRVKNLIDHLQKASESTELADRLKLQERLIKQGKSVGEAAHQAYLLAPYSRKGLGQGLIGGTLMALTPLVPFLNSKIQGVARMFENRQGKRRIAGMPADVFLRGLVLSAFSLAAYGLASEDDRWETEDPNNKLKNDIFYVGDQAIYLPRAFEFGTFFGALPVFALDAMRSQQGGKDLQQGVTQALLSTAFFNPIPQAVRPLLETVVNYDFFRMRPLESQGMEALPVAERANDQTSTAAKLLSRGITAADETVLPEGSRLGLSPIKVQRLIEGYTGSIGTMLLAASDALLGAAGVIPEKPGGVFGSPSSLAGGAATVAGVGRFVRGDDDRVSRFVGDFYSMKREADQIHKSFSNALLVGDQDKARGIVAENRPALAARSMMEGVERQLGIINAQMKAVSAREDMTLDQRREVLARYRQMRNDLSRRAVEATQRLQ